MSNKTLLKLGLIGAVFFGLWRVWENDAAVNAFILFCTAGVVPGTTKELTPEQVYMVLGGILFVAIMLIFSKQLVRDIRSIRSAWRNRRSRKRQPVIAEAMSENPASVALPVATVAAAAVAPTEAVTTAATPRRRRKASVPEPVVVITLPAKPGAVQLAWRRVWPHLLAAAGITLGALIGALGWVARQLSRLSLEAFRFGMRGWLATEPYLRQFDRWLERKLKGNQDVMSVVHFGTEMTKVAQLGVAELRMRVNRLTRPHED